MKITPGSKEKYWSPFRGECLDKPHISLLRKQKDASFIQATRNFMPSAKKYNSDPTIFFHL
jgi:hypothetical protein